MPKSSDAIFRERLATYLIGVAIGCVLLGFLWMARRQAAAHDAAARRAAAAAAAGGTVAPQQPAPVMGPGSTPGR